MSMEAFRKMIEVDEGTRSVRREAEPAVFWEEVVKEIAEAWKAADVCIVLLQ